MRVFRGKCVVEGAAVGQVFVYEPPKWEGAHSLQQHPQEEWQRYVTAAQKAAQALEQRYQQVLQNSNEEQAAIFEAQQMMLEDEDFSMGVKSLIDEMHYSASYAVMETAESFAQLFLQMDSNIMKSKAADMRDIASLVLRFLQDKQLIYEQMPAQCILVAERLLPGELAEMDANKVLAVVLKESSAHSHLAVLAAGRSLPLLICPDLDIQKHWTLMQAGVDTQTQSFYLQADKDVQQSILEKYALTPAFPSTLQLREQTVQSTIEGFQVCLNIGHPKELTASVLQACDGVGVFRSEFQFIGKHQEPKEEELFEDYRQTVEKLAGKTLVIRTIDIGADKPAEFLNMEKEANPALGCRGIRLCFKNKALFIKQLRAILQASAYGKIAILLPMICRKEEISQSKILLQEAMQSLDQEQIPYDKNISLGIMIETPAAALMAEDLAQHVDFFSLGSNDLTQYCLAADRDNAQMEAYYDACHPAVFKLLEMTIQAAQKEKIGCCLCGELAHNAQVTQTLVDMGFRQFSVSPAFISHMQEKLALCKV